mgnify:FL=1
MKENCDWKKCLDRIENKGFDDDAAYSEILEYIREVATVDEKREVLQNVEQRVKRIVNCDLDYSPSLRYLSENEHDVIDLLMGIRYVVLNEMMLHPTPAEVERFRYQNDKLFKLTQEYYAQCRNMWRTLFHTPYKVDDRYCYEVEGVLRFEYGDDDAVVKLENDDYYGSDFQYMIHLQDELIYKYKMDSLLNGVFGSFVGATEDGYKQINNMLDDGDSWDECSLHKPEFADICVCYAMHALHTHQDYCLPDILRMDDFVVKVHLQYENEVCDTRDAEIVPHKYEPSWFQKLVEEDVKEFGGKHTLNPTRKK